MDDQANKGRSFDFGRVIGGSFSLIGRNFIPFFVLAVILSGGPYVVSLLVPYYLYENPIAPVTTLLSGLVGLIVQVVSMCLLQGALTRAAIDDLTGKGVSIPAALGSGLGNAFALVGLGIVSGIGIAIGLVLLIVPGLLLMVRWIAATPAIVVEKLSIYDAMGRSSELTVGSRWAAFGAGLLYLVSYYALSSVAEFAGQALSTYVPNVEQIPVAAIAVMAVTDTLMTMIGTVGVAAIYFELRRVNEGVDVAELASVFD